MLAGCVVVATVACGLESLFAQSRTFKSGVEVVPLTVTVTDTAGCYVPDLTVAGFAIFEEGHRQTISHFASSNVPIDIGFVLDPERQHA